MKTIVSQGCSSQSSCDWSGRRATTVKEHSTYSEKTDGVRWSSEARLDVLSHGFCLKQDEHHVFLSCLLTNEDDMFPF